ncbi:MAG: RNA 2',3'-cyclic phosphodiesterase [Candidatus Doudnabacteria bacterium]|nr:RNA 2',3'-cyclic phosphodiesterase [Candidatus Doudnabacteria bacterium]
MRRVFIAINFPGSGKMFLEKISLKLKKQNQSADIKWVNPQSFHLTLIFLGYLNEEQINQTAETMRRIAPFYPSFILSTGGLGAFPDMSNPQVVYLDIRERKTACLQKLQKALNQEFIKNLKIRPDYKKFNAHITLARVKDRAVKANPIEIKTVYEFKVTAVDLMESLPERAGTRYKVLERFFLET